MTPEKEILDFKGQVRFLETMASEVGDFSPWLEKALNGDYRPFYLGQTDLVVRLVDIYRATGIGLRQAFRTSVARLVCSWNESFDNKSYLGLLLYMSGRLRVVDSYEIDPGLGRASGGLWASLQGLKTRRGEAIFIWRAYRR